MELRRTFFKRSPPTSMMPKGPAFRASQQAMWVADSLCWRALTITATGTYGILRNLLD